MAHTLIATLAIGLSAALVLGFVARKLGFSPIVGYLLAGIAVGPHTPGFVADAALAMELAEIGVILLMFGVGLHFSLKDLLAVRRIAIPGAVFQSALATALGIAVGCLSGWPLGAGLVFGLALSVASTVVLIRGLADQQALDSVPGHVAIGWLLIEDLLTVLILVLMPALAESLGGHPGAEISVVTALALTTGKVLLLTFIVFFVGSKGVPFLLRQVARVQSRELFTLAVLAVALGIAYGSSELFGVSMALGAFLGGLVVGQSDLSHQAAADALPMRDAFAVLFFVSVGMLFDPSFVFAQPWLVLAALGIVVVGKPLAAILIVVVLGHPARTALVVAAGLAQIGEFSFILAQMGKDLGILSADAQNAILATALLSITVNPVAFKTVAPLEAWLRKSRWLSAFITRRSGALLEIPSRHEHRGLRGHAVLCGYGRVGSVLGKLLAQRGWPFVVIEQDRAIVERLRREGVDARSGDGANELLLDSAHIDRARILLATVPDALATRLMVEHARKVNPEIEIVARVHHESERDYLRAMDHTEGVLGELEIALEMARHLLRKFGVSTIEAQAAVMDLRATPGDGPAAGATRVTEIEVPAGSRAVGKRISELGIGKGALIVTISRAGDFVIPNGQTELQAHDTLLVLADSAGSKLIELAVG
jgi:CPA2 family monovalent cation:H+ antiporter-2